MTGDLLAASLLFLALGFAGVVAWALWMTWLYVHPRSEPLPPEWVNDGHRPRCQRRTARNWRHEPRDTTYCDWHTP